MYTTKELPLNVMLAFYGLKGDELSYNNINKMKQFHIKMVESYLAFDHFTTHTWKYVS